MFVTTTALELMLATFLTQVCKRKISFRFVNGLNRLDHLKYLGTDMYCTALCYILQNSIQLKKCNVFLIDDATIYLQVPLTQVQNQMGTKRSW